MCQLHLHNKSVCARNCIYTSGPSVLKRKFQLTAQIALSHLPWRTQFQAEVPPALHNLLVRKRKFLPARSCPGTHAQEQVEPLCDPRLLGWNTATDNSGE